MQMSGQIRYTDEVWVDAVAQVTTHGNAVKQVVGRVGIRTNFPYTWMAQVSQP